MMNIYKISFFLLAIILANTAFAQLGGNATPMQYSTHIYSINMEVEENTPVWQIYAGHFGVSEIESGDADGSLLQRNDSYRVISEDVEGSRAIIEIEFNGNMEPGDYTVAYRETNAETCFKTVRMHIVMQGPFDIDVALLHEADLARCPDLSNLFIDDPEEGVYQTDISYRVSMEKPDDEDGFYSGAFWAFNYIVSVNGRDGGNSSGVASVHIAYSGIDQTVPVTGNPSVYENSLVVDNSDEGNRISEVIITVTYNDALGVTQDISFEISEIEGEYNEIDIDPFNRVEHVIYTMPHVGQITALN